MMSSPWDLHSNCFSTCHTRACKKAMRFPPPCTRFKLTMYTQERNVIVIFWKCTWRLKRKCRKCIWMPENTGALSFIPRSELHRNQQISFSTTSRPSSWHNNSSSATSPKRKPILKRHAANGHCTTETLLVALWTKSFTFSTRSLLHVVFNSGSVWRRTSHLSGHIMNSDLPQVLSLTWFRSAKISR